MRYKTIQKTYQGNVYHDGATKKWMEKTNSRLHGDELKDKRLAVFDHSESNYRQKAMIVDDSKIARKAIKKLLTQLNINTVCEATDAVEAYDLYIEYEPDLVTMDITMEGKLNGIDALKKIKTKFPHAKVIMITSHGEEEKIMDALSFGASQYILKPVTIEKLDSSLKKLKEEKYTLFSNVQFYPMSLKEFHSDIKKKYVVLIAQNSFEKLEVLQEYKMNFVAVKVPQIYFDNKTYDHGILVLELGKYTGLKLIDSLSTLPDEGYEKHYENYQTIFGFFDANYQEDKEFIEHFVKFLPDSCNFFGASFYDETTQDHSKGVLYTDSVVLRNCGVLIYSKVEATHSYIKNNSILNVIGAVGNNLEYFQQNLYTVDELPALDFYINTILEETGIQMIESNTQGVLQRFALIGIDSKNNLKNLSIESVSFSDRSILVKNIIEEIKAIVVVDLNKYQYIQDAKSLKSIIQIDGHDPLKGDESFEKELESVYSKKSDILHFGFTSYAQTAKEADSRFSYTNKKGTLVATL